VDYKQSHHNSNPWILISHVDKSNLIDPGQTNPLIDRLRPLEEAKTTKGPSYLGCNLLFWLMGARRIKAARNDGTSKEYCMVSSAGELLQGRLIAICRIGSVFIEVLYMLTPELYGFGYFDMGERVCCRSRCR
jgi:hypothetical protein